MSSERISDLILRAGLAFAFLYPPVNALFDPDAWIGYFPWFLYDIVPNAILLHSFGVIEVIIAIWILSGRKIFWPSMAAALMLFSIVAFNVQNFQVLFRDLSIAALALAVAVRNWPTMEKSHRA